jgi:hypothetical protein
MCNHSPELADVFMRYGEQYGRHYRLSPQQLKAFSLIKACRTAALGGHMQQCQRCGFERPVYNSCRNRHCPKCQTMAKEKWLDHRRAELLPCGYYHLVFTLPHEPNALVMCNQKKLLGLLFKTAAEVLACFARDPNWRLGGRLGIIAVLHTWSQTLMDHFHLHCLVPAGALSFDQSTWINARHTYLFKNRSLAKAFKHRYIKQLISLYQAGELQFVGKTAPLAQADNFGKLICTLRKKDWIVYTKRPFTGPEQVLEYLGRYTHRVAIANHRILSMQDDKVTFAYRDRADENKAKVMSLSATEFIRRFLLHVLPDGFVKIRYFGFLSHRNKNRCLDLIRKLIDPGFKPVETIKQSVFEMMLRITGIDIRCCPRCGFSQMVAMPLTLDATPVASGARSE